MSNLVYKRIDLGLPSGTLWADRNVGAINETSLGYYFAWGETDESRNFDDSWKDDGSKMYTEANTPFFNNLTGEGTLYPSSDAATIHMGRLWRMPTRNQIEELTEETEQNWVENYKGSGVNGLVFTSKRNANSIFIPAAGFRDYDELCNKDTDARIWSSSSFYMSGYACMLSSESFPADVDCECCYVALQVRGVIKL